MEDHVKKRNKGTIALTSIPLLALWVKAAFASTSILLTQSFITQVICVYRRAEKWTEFTLVMCTEAF